MKRILVILTILAAAAAAAENTASEPGLSVLRPAKHQPKPSSTVVMQQVDISAEIDGLAARSTIKTVFENTTNDNLEGVWTFPLPQGAAADRFSMTVLNPAISTALTEGTLMLADSAEAIFKKITERRGNYVFNTAEDYEGTYHFRPSGHASGFGGSDPGVLEVLNNGQYRMSMFPVEKCATKTCLVSAVHPLQLQAAGDARRVVYTLPLGPIKEHLAVTGSVRLSARIHALPSGAKIISSFRAEEEHSAGDAILSATLHWGDLTAENWDITIERPATQAFGSECILQAHRPDPNSPGVFSLTILTHDSIGNAELRVQNAAGKNIELSGASLPEIKRDASATAYGLYDSAGLATVTLRGTANGTAYERSWQIHLPETSSDNAAVTKFYAAARAQELVAQGKLYDAAMLSGRCHIVGKDTSFLILDGEKRYRKFHVAHGKDETGELRGKLEASERVLESQDEFSIAQKQ